MERRGLIPTDHEVSERSLDLDETYNAILGSRLVRDHTVLSISKSQSLDTLRSGNEEPEHTRKIIKRNGANGGRLRSPRLSAVKSSLGTQFSIDIDGLLRNGYGSLTGIEHEVSTTSSALTFPCSAIKFASPNVQKAFEVTNHHHTRRYDHAVSKLPESQSHNSDFCIWKMMQIEPTLPIFLKFSDVRYEVTVKRSRGPDAVKHVLHGITGSVNPGEVLALMGPSGGGKTTLLNLLSGRVATRDHGGSVTYNDKPYSKSLKQRIGFVLQDDVVFPHLTVRETLTYAAHLRLPKTLTRQQKEERAMNVILELGLERCQDTVIGGAFVKGISGGERKRVCIGNEILLNPSLLFLDEPTSGLDSTTALRITQMLLNFAKAGKTVVTTIHQPSSRLFNKFDKLVLLSKGSSLYFGKASVAMEYFSSIGCSPLIAMNPAEFLIDLATGNTNDKSMPSELDDMVVTGSRESRHETRPTPMDIHEYLVGAYETRVAHIEKKNLLKPVQLDSRWEIQRGSSDSRVTGASWWEQFNILFWRGLKERRHDYLSWVRVTQVLSTATITGLLWWHSNSSPKQLQDQVGLLFFISVFWGFFPVFTAIFTFPQERAMLIKERSVGMYKLSAYFIARNMSDLPLDLILPIVFLLIVYFMVGLKPVLAVFLKSMLTIFLCIIAAQGLGLAIGAALMDVKKATTLASVIIMTFMLSGGFFVQRVPSFMSWIRYLSFTYHTFRLLLKIQYGCSNVSPNSPDPCKSPLIQGSSLDDGGKEVGAMIAMVIGYRLLAYVSLRRMRLAKLD